MTLRKAIERKGETIAECPVGGACFYKVENSPIWQRCGYFEGREKSNRGTKVKCSFPRVVQH